MGAAVHSVPGGTLVLYNGRCYVVANETGDTAQTFRDTMTRIGMTVLDYPQTELDAARLIDPTFSNMSLLPASRFGGEQARLFA